MENNTDRSELFTWFENWLAKNLLGRVANPRPLAKIKTALRNQPQTQLMQPVMPVMRPVAASLELQRAPGNRVKRGGY